MLSVKAVGKSLLLALAGTSVVFCFLMMGAIPIMALLARLGGNVQKTSEVVMPEHFLRDWGLPLAVITFVVLFGLTMHRSRRIERQAHLPHEGEVA